MFILRIIFKNISEIMNKNLNVLFNCNGFTIYDEIVILCILCFILTFGFGCKRMALVMTASIVFPIYLCFFINIVNVFSNTILDIDISKSLTKFAIFNLIFFSRLFAIISIIMTVLLNETLIIHQLILTINTYSQFVDPYKIAMDMNIEEYLCLAIFLTVFLVEALSYRAYKVIMPLYLSIVPASGLYYFLENSRIIKKSSFSKFFIVRLNYFYLFVMIFSVITQILVKHLIDRFIKERFRNIINK